MALLGVAICAAGLVAPTAAMAKVRCQESAAGAVLSISITQATYAGVRRSGDRVRVFDVLSGKTGCESDATVTEIEQIKLFADSTAAASIELRKRPFAPGLGTDEDAFPEIEIEASGSGLVEVFGGPTPEHFQFMDDGSESGVNLNPDEDQDLDVVVSRQFRDRMLFVVNGGDGADRIDAVGTPALEMFAVGGDGDDTLISPRTGAILVGERGSDRLIGSPAFDLIAPGRGADRVSAGAGSDLLEIKPDGSRDRIDCGSGRDSASRGDRFDRLRSCS